MSVPEARKVALQYYGFSANPKRKPTNVDINVSRSFGTRGWDSASDGGRPSALARLQKLIDEHWDEHIGTMSRFGRLSMTQLNHYADMAYGDPLEEEAANGKQTTPSLPKAGAAPTELLEPWMRALCDESPSNYLVELIAKEGRHLLLVNTSIQG